MSQTTEAACLLQSGSMYFRRIGLKARSGDVIFAGIKPGAVSLYFGDEPIYHFDLEGRWQRAFVDGMHYLKGLDGSVRSVGREREAGGMVLRRGTLPYAEAVDLDASIRSTALGLIDDLDAGNFEVLLPPPDRKPLLPERLRAFLESVAGWDAAAWFAHRERYISAYGPLPFLPPDCPNALVLQATLGHADGRAFGRGPAAEHYVRSVPEFQEHAGAVRRLVGRRIAQHKGVFLAGADVLRRPFEEVIGLLEAARLVLPIGVETPRSSPFGENRDDDDPDLVPTNLGLVHAFLDDFVPPLPDSEGWRRLRKAHLGRITLGVESGDPQVRSSFGKSWTDDDLRSLIADLKAAEIGVGVVVLIGAGGRAKAEDHLESTSALLAGLPLEAGDLVSLVDARSLDDALVDPLSDAETLGQVAALRSRVAAARPSKGPKLVAYNPDKHWN